MADTLGVDVCQRPEQLVDVQLHLQHGHRRLELVEVTRCAVDGLWDILEDKVEVDFIFLLRGEIGQPTERGSLWGSTTYPVAVGVVEGLEFDDVGVAHNPHNLQLTVLRMKWLVTVKRKLFHDAVP
jgi:hypothetical protein